MIPIVGSKVRVTLELTIKSVNIQEKDPDRSFLCGDAVVGSVNGRPKTAYISGVPMSAILEEEL